LVVRWAARLDFEPARSVETAQERAAPPLSRRSRSYRTWRLVLAARLRCARCLRFVLRPLFRARQARAPPRVRRLRVRMAALRLGCSFAAVARFVQQRLAREVRLAVRHRSVSLRPALLRRSLECLFRALARLLAQLPRAAAALRLRGVLRDRDVLQSSARRDRQGRGVRSASALAVLRADRQRRWPRSPYIPQVRTCGQKALASPGPRR
jgi:hypothetical protein